MQTSKTILGFDFGTRFTGVAIGNLLIKSAKALTTIERKNKQYFWWEVEALIKKWQPQYLVVGEPLTLDEQSQTMTELAAKFCRQLEAKYGLKVFQVDERLTSRLAQDIIRDSQEPMDKQLIDQVAAQIILQAWFDTHET